MIVGKQAHTPERREEDVLLDAAGIDHLAALLAGALGQAAIERREALRLRLAAIERREALRLRLAAEDILAVWQRGAPDGAVCKFRCGSRWGRAYIELLVPGRGSTRPRRRRAKTRRSCTPACWPRRGSRRSTAIRTA